MSSDENQPPETSRLITSPNTRNKRSSLESRSPLILKEHNQRVTPQKEVDKIYAASNESSVPVNSCDKQIPVELPGVVTAAPQTSKHPCEHEQNLTVARNLVEELVNSASSTKQTSLEFNLDSGGGLGENSSLTKLNNEDEFSLCSISLQSESSNSVGRSLPDLLQSAKNLQAKNTDTDTDTTEYDTAPETDSASLQENILSELQSKSDFNLSEICRDLAKVSLNTSSSSLLLSQSETESGPSNQHDSDSGSFVDCENHPENQDITDQYNINNQYLQTVIKDSLVEVEEINESFKSTSSFETLKTNISTSEPQQLNDTKDFETSSSANETVILDNLNQTVIVSSEENSKDISNQTEPQLENLNTKSFDNTIEKEPLEIKNKGVNSDPTNIDELLKDSDFHLETQKQVESPLKEEKQLNLSNNTTRESEELKVEYIHERSEITCKDEQVESQVKDYKQLNLSSKEDSCSLNSTVLISDTLCENLKKESEQGETYLTENQELNLSNKEDSCSLNSTVVISDTLNKSEVLKVESIPETSELNLICNQEQVESQLKDTKQLNLSNKEESCSLNSTVLISDTLKESENLNKELEKSKPEQVETHLPENQDLNLSNKEESCSLNSTVLISDTLKESENLNKELEKSEPEQVETHLPENQDLNLSNKEESCSLNSTVLISDTLKESENLNKELEKSEPEQVETHLPESQDLNLTNKEGSFSLNSTVLISETLKGSENLNKELEKSEQDQEKTHLTKKQELNLSNKEDFCSLNSTVLISDTQRESESLKKEPEQVEIHLTENQELNLSNKEDSCSLNSTVLICDTVKESENLKKEPEKSETEQVETHLKENQELNLSNKEDSCSLNSTVVISDTLNKSEVLKVESIPETSELNLICNQEQVEPHLIGNQQFNVSNKEDSYSLNSTVLISDTLKESENLKAESEIKSSSLNSAELSSNSKPSQNLKSQTLPQIVNKNNSDKNIFDKRENSSDPKNNLEEEENQIETKDLENCKTNTSDLTSIKNFDNINLSKNLEELVINDTSKESDSEADKTILINYNQPNANNKFEISLNSQKNLNDSNLQETSIVTKPLEENHTIPNEDTINIIKEKDNVSLSIKDNFEEFCQVESEKKVIKDKNISEINCIKEEKSKLPLNLQLITEDIQIKDSEKKEDIDDILKETIEIQKGINDIQISKDSPLSKKPNVLLVSEILNKTLDIPSSSVDPKNQSTPKLESNIEQRDSPNKFKDEFVINRKSTLDLNDGIFSPLKYISKDTLNKSPLPCIQPGEDSFKKLNSVLNSVETEPQFNNILEICKRQQRSLETDVELPLIVDGDFVEGEKVFGLQSNLNINSTFVLPDFEQQAGVNFDLISKEAARLSNSLRNDDPLIDRVKLTNSMADAIGSSATFTKRGSARGVSTATPEDPFHSKSHLQSSPPLVRRSSGDRKSYPRPITKAESPDPDLILSGSETVNLSEAGPETAAAVAASSLVSDNAFKDPSAFEFLSSVGNSRTQPLRDLRKESLYVKFDPLVGNNPAIHPASGDIDNKSKIKSLKGEPNANEISLNSGLVNQTIQEEDKSFSSTPRKNPARDLIDKLILLSPSPIKEPAGATGPQVKDSHTQATPIKDKEPNINIKQFESILGDNNKMKEELELVRELMTKQEKEYEDALEEKQRTIESLSQRNKELEDKENKLNEQAKINERMSIFLKEYEKSISNLTAEKEYDRQMYEADKEALIKDKEQAMGHLEAIEVAFADLHKKYERAKNVIDGFKRNEEVLKLNLAESKETIREQEQKYELFKTHVFSQLESANQELDATKRSHQGDIAKLTAMLKKAEIKISSLQEMLDQKVKENEELANICDELIAKVN